MKAQRNEDTKKKNREKKGEKREGRGEKGERGVRRFSPSGRSIKGRQGSKTG